LRPLILQALQSHCFKVLAFPAAPFHLTLCWMCFVQIFIFIILLYVDFPSVFRLPASPVDSCSHSKRLSLYTHDQTAQCLGFNVINYILVLDQIILLIMRFNSPCTISFLCRPKYSCQHLSFSSDEVSKLQNNIACSELWVDEDFEITAVEVKGRSPECTWEVCRVSHGDIQFTEMLTAQIGYLGNSMKWRGAS
jgi:hypothetical protein